MRKKGTLVMTCHRKCTENIIRDRKHKITDIKQNNDVQRRKKLWVWLREDSINECSSP